MVWTWVIFPFSPTFFAISIIKTFCNQKYRSIVQRLWTISFAVYNVILLTAGAVQPELLKPQKVWIVIVISLLAWSRIAEIFQGFYRDAVDRFNSVQHTTNISSLERIHWLVISYGENIINFAVLYYFTQSYLNNCAFHRKLNSLADAVYFSAMTITTTGYGDIAPNFSIAKALCVYEALSGTFLLVIVLAVYLGNIIVPNKTRSDAINNTSDI